MNSRAFNFTYQINIESTNNKKLELWIPYPQSNEVQKISNVQISSNGLNYTIENENVHNNKYVYVNHQQGTNKSTTFSMTFDVLRKEHQNVNYKNVNPQKYLGSYQTVPTGEEFTKIINENNLSRYDIRGIYDYVLNGMHYGKPTSKDNKYFKDPWLFENQTYGLKNVTRDEIVALYETAKKEQGNYTFGNGNSIYACDIGVGNCTDYHSYFMSLNRTLGVPARFHMGFPVPNNGDAGKVGGYHCWADYYVQGKGWSPVDISEADKDPSKIDYFFGNVDQNRVDMMVGRDFVLKGYEKEIANFLIYPIMEVNDQELSKYKKSFKYNNL
tara:strand:- start:88 stop:1071 length:984 start_codon:yes stop_codon:yes gene_type:complete